jgi:hypothetical protein
MKSRAGVGEAMKPSFRFLMAGPVEGGDIIDDDYIVAHAGQARIIIASIHGVDYPPQCIQGSFLSQHHRLRKVADIYEAQLPRRNRGKPG